MLENFLEAVRLPRFFRDFIYAIVGFVFLLFLNWYFAPSLSRVPNYNLLGTWGVVAILLSFSYLLGFIFYNTALLWLFIVRINLSAIFLSVSDEKKVDWMIRFKKGWKSFFSDLTTKEFTAMPKRAPGQVTLINAFKVIQENSIIQDINHRRVASSVTADAILGSWIFGVIFLKEESLFFGIGWLAVLIVLTLCCLKVGKGTGELLKLVIEENHI